MTISEICERFDLSQDTLRYYEKIGLISKIKRNTGGFREYTDLDCGRITAIKWMRAAGMPIETLMEYIGMVRGGDNTIAARKRLLSELRAQLNARVKEHQATLRLLDEKIEHYETHTAPSEAELFLPRGRDDV